MRMENIHKAQAVSGELAALGKQKAGNRASGSFNGVLEDQLTVNEESNDWSISMSPLNDKQAGVKKKESDDVQSEVMQTKSQAAGKGAAFSSELVVSNGDTGVGEWSVSMSALTLDGSNPEAEGIESASDQLNSEVPKYYPASYGVGAYQRLLDILSNPVGTADGEVPGNRSTETVRRL